MIWYTSKIMAKTPKNAAKPGTTKKKQSAAPHKVKHAVGEPASAQKSAKGRAILGVFRLSGQALRILATNWKVIGGIALLYCLLSALFAQSLSTAKDITSAPTPLDQPGGGWSSLAASTSVFVALLGSSGSVASGAALYQFFFALLFTLAIIWVLRQLYAGHAVRIRDGFYKGMTPLVQYVLVLLVVVLQLVPFIIGSIIYGSVTSNGIASTPLEQLLWLLAFLALTVASVYMVASSLFALYIVTLPDTTPLQALRAARQLVRGRRWTVVRKLVFLPVMLFVFLGVVMVPLLLFAAALAPWVFFALSGLLLPVVHSYMYAFYRELL